MKRVMIVSIASTAILGGIAAAFLMKLDLFVRREDVPLQSNPGERMSLHIFVSRPDSDSLPAPSLDFVKQAIETKFGVRLQVTATAEGDYNTRLQALLAANDPPDMWLGLGSDGGASYALDNALADMTLFVSPSTMPNYFKYWMNTEELRQYQFHNKFMRAPIPYDKQSNRAYYIRKDWLDRLGLPIPDTYDAYVRTLHVLTFGDPDGNGKNDTYGFTASGGGSSLSTDWPEYVKNGLLYPAYYDGKKLVIMQMDERVGHVVDDILKVMNAGVVEPDWFLNKRNDVVDKAVRGKVGVVLGTTADFAYDSNPNSLQTRSKAIDPHANWVPFNPFGHEPLQAAVMPGSPFVFSNNAAGLNPDKLKRLAEILDWLCGEEGFLLTHYGLEGKHYTRQGNTITLIPSGIENDIVKQGRFLDIWGFFTPISPQVLGLKVIDPRMTARDETIARTIAGIPVHEGVGTTLTPPLGVSVETMRDKQNELQVRMLFTDKSGRNWPEYRKEIMQNYNGDEIFRQYEIKIREAHEGK
ncbi:extracellular solute-binding protein [Paenibacillus sp. MBLB4367]|uniref:extracellular solute-binding protein n=1 Tax=Paenibacillus sp. MBLB4367 TaxID=3384767 RepID=UPI003907EBC8